MSKSHIGILEVDRETSLPNLRSTKGGFGFEGTTPKYWNGTAWSAFSGASGGASTWDELYSNDKSLSIDEESLTFTLAHATNNGLTFTSGVGTGNIIDISNSGTGYDIEGTGDTWSITKAGVMIATGLTMLDNEAITLGTGTDATIAWDGTYLNFAGIVDFDDNITLAASATITQAGLAANTVFTITAGDAVMSDGSLSITDADNAETVTVINNTATTIGNASSAGLIQLESTSLTTGALLNLQLTEATLAGGTYVRAWDATGSTEVFSVGENGLVTVAGSAAGTDAVVITLGDLLLGDSDGSVFESENGTTTLLTLDNKAGVIASDTAVLLIDAGGAVASGGNLLRVAPTGTPNAGAIGIEFVGGGKALTAMYIDADPTASSLVYFTSGGALGADKATLEVVSVPAANNADSSVLRLEQTSTTGAGLIVTMVQGDVSEPFINFESTAGSGNSVDATRTTAGAAVAAIRVAYNGTDAYIMLTDTPS